MFYRFYIRSLLYYRCTLYDSPRTNLNIIDRIQSKSLKISLGTMLSSPNYVILAKAQELSLLFRRQYLANKHLFKYRSIIKDMVLQNAQVNKENLVNPFWRLKTTPLLADAFIDTKHFNNYIKEFKTNSPYFDVISKPQFINQTSYFHSIQNYRY